MPSSDSDYSLRTVSYIVLGLLATAGPRTSYELEHDVGVSVGFFWQFPRSQLYAEPRRLVELGLITFEQEESGRRRRTYQITEEGRRALRLWLETPPEQGQVRDPALLKLFFADAAPEIVGPLARRMTAELEARLDFLEQPGLGGEPHHRRVLEWGRIHARASLAYWRSLLTEVSESKEE